MSVKPTVLVKNETPAVPEPISCSWYWRVCHPRPPPLPVANSEEVPPTFAAVPLPMVGLRVSSSKPHATITSALAKDTIPVAASAATTPRDPRIGLSPQGMKGTPLVRRERMGDGARERLRARRQARLQAVQADRVGLGASRREGRVKRNIGATGMRSGAERPSSVFIEPERCTLESLPVGAHTSPSPCAGAPGSLMGESHR